MMKKFLYGSLILAMLVSLFACGKKTVDSLTWQEQYDLGLHYLSEGEYEQAILAFEAAIEIDPKQADAYIGLAEVYTAQGDTEKAVEILNKAISEIGETDELVEAKATLAPPEPQPSPEPSPETTPESTPEPPDVPAPEPSEEPPAESSTEPIPTPAPLPTPAPTSPPTPVSSDSLRSERQDRSDGSYYILEYNSANRVVHWIYYGTNGSVTLDYTAEAGNYLEYNVYTAGQYIWVNEYNVDGKRVRESQFELDGTPLRVDEHEYDSAGNETRWIYYSAGGQIILDYTAEAGNYLEHNVYTAGQYIWVNECNVDGKRVRESQFELDGTPLRVDEHEYDSAGNETRWIYYSADGQVILDYTAEAGNYLTHNVYTAGQYIWIREYDSAGNEVHLIKYTLDGTLISVE